MRTEVGRAHTLIRYFFMEPYLLVFLQVLIKKFRVRKATNLELERRLVFDFSMKKENEKTMPKLNP